MTDAYPESVKAAVLAALMTGQSIGAVARAYNIPEGTVKSWKSRNHVADTVASVATSATPKKEIGDLILEYLEANLRALKAQAEVFADPAWLNKQEASQLAILHGVMTDKAIRLLEAMNAHAENE